MDEIILSQNPDGTLALKQKNGDKHDLLFTGTPQQMQGVAIMILEVIRALAIRNN